MDFIATLFIILVIAAILTKIYSRLSVRICTSKASMKDKVIIVTGSNTGIGFETALDLARKGGRIILACRNEEKALAARNRILKETGNEEIVYLHLDLSSLDSVRSFVQKFKSTERKLDVLVNNAGVFGFGEKYTKDGIVEGNQVNFFGPFLLTLLLLPLLKQTKGRIVNVSSLLHIFGRVNFEHMNKAGFYNTLWTYSNNKLWMVIFTAELARILKGTGVTVSSMHPGVIMTDLTTKLSFIYLLHVFLWWFCGRTAKEGAQTIIFLAVTGDSDQNNGKFLMDCRSWFMSWFAYDKTLARKLWDYSENIVKHKYND